MKRACGFTLIEIAIALFLIAIITTAGLKFLTAQAESAAYSAMIKKQDTIKQALITYLGKFKRLPCPDTKAIPDGNETRTALAPATCVANFGRIPYATLGLSRDSALDSWESFISYAVSPAWTLTLTDSAPVAGVPQTNVAANAFSVGSVGALTVNDRIPATNAAFTALADPATGSGAVVVLVSHGKNSAGAVTVKGTTIVAPVVGTDEAENIDGANTIFVKREVTDSEVPVYGAFDDFVMFIRPDELISPLSRDGSLKPSTASVAEQLATIRDTAIGRVTATCTIPTLGDLALPALTLIDAWGQPIQYNRYTTPLPPALSTAAPQPAGTIAFKIWSRGPNVADNGDDAVAGTPVACITTTDNICLTVTYDMLRARIPPPACP